MTTSSKGVAAGLGAYLIWGLGPLFWNQLDDVAAGDVVIFRMAATFATLVVVHLVRRSGRHLMEVARDRRAMSLAVTTGLLLGVNWLVYVWAVYDHRILEASLGYFINPLVNVVLGVMILGERLRPVQWVAVAMAAAGVVVLTIDVGTLPWVSLVLAGTFGVYGLIRKTSPAGPLEGLTLEMAVLLPLAVAVIAWRAVGGHGAVGAAVPSRDLLLLATGMFTAAPLLLFATAARRIDLSVVGILQYVAPTLQFLLGVFVYGESWSGGQVVGYFIIWAGLVVFAVDSISAGRASASDEVERVVVEDLSG